MKNKPILFEHKENCCGCTACFAVCPTNSIAMIPDEEGFLYPVVDEQTCIYCYKCIDICRFKDDQINREL